VVTDAIAPRWPGPSHHRCRSGNRGSQRQKTKPADRLIRRFDLRQQISLTP
jgi:hypothetical protein